LDDALKEDKRRLRLVVKTLQTLEAGQHKAAKRLLKRLSRKRRPPTTLASAAYYFELRERILDHLVKLTWKLAPEELVTATLLPRKSRVCSLQTFDPFKFGQRLRADLTRAGGRKARGWVFASVHGEFNDQLGLWDPHYHIIVAGAEMIGVIDSLRARGKYRLEACSEDDKPAKKAPPILKRRVKRSQLRHALSYVLQTWWPQTGVDGTARGQGPRRRLKGPRHTEFLLWLDRQKPQHMYMLFNLQVGRKGLRPTKPLKTCTSIGGSDVG
jgi:hypothetical protein